MLRVFRGHATLFLSCVIYHSNPTQPTRSHQLKPCPFLPFCSRFSHRRSDRPPQTRWSLEERIQKKKKKLWVRGLV